MQPYVETIDPADVARFEHLADDWWNPRGSMAALHKFNPLRVNWMLERIAAHFPVQRGAGKAALGAVSILDIGCGGGILAESLARAGARVTGIDPARRGIEMAQRHCAAAGLDIDYRCVSAEALVERSERFDVVCAMEVVEHVTDVRAFMATAGALTRPGGMLFAATLNRTLKSFALAIVGAEYVLRWVPRGTHQWEKFVTPQELEEAMELGGVDPVERTGVVYDPVRDCWRPSRDMAVNYMMAGAKPE